MRKNSVGTFILGLVLLLSSAIATATNVTKLAIESEVMALEKEFPALKIEMMDERFTSKMAFQSMIDSGMKKKQRQGKGTIDMISAAIILQSYLEKR